MLTAGCAHYPATPVLTPGALAAAAPPAGYRLASFPATPPNTDSLFVVLTFSGGGTRAAALAYGVLLELARTPVDTGRARRSLLDEVDMISSVSGGSFTAAYYALHGPDSLPAFPQRFLEWDATRALIQTALAPALLRLFSPHFGRGDLAAEAWDARVFHGATYGSLLARRRRPFLLVNATDIGEGAGFSFTQEAFDPMCGDLAQFSLARAVAASSSVPGLLSPITLENHAGRCGYSQPGWVASGLRDARTNPSAFRAAALHESYADAVTRPYVHLMDGGPSDNLGLRPVLRALGSTAGEFSILRMMDTGAVKHVIVIVVNARGATARDADRRPDPPGALDVLLTAAGTPFDRYSDESVARLTAVADAARKERIAAHCEDVLAHRLDPSHPPAAALPAGDVRAVEVSLAQVSDPLEREFLLRVPTAFALPHATVARVRDAAGPLLRDNPDFRNIARALVFEESPDARPAPRCLADD